MLVVSSKLIFKTHTKDIIAQQDNLNCNHHKKQWKQSLATNIYINQTF